MLNRRSLVPAGAVALAAGAVFFFQAFSAAQAPAKPERVEWEYKTGFKNDVEALNERGKDGWELVAVDRGFLYFKRPK